MRNFTVYQQRPPVLSKVIGADGRPEVQWAANLVEVGVVMARNGAAAIERARELREFRMASRKTLGAYPIVEPRA